ncbi:MAG: HAMP domain-containing protein [Gammaproteobacteria bacterium]|nr:HAMP domain-containing protein [Gammaproteobacteria bacterium]
MRIRSRIRGPKLRTKLLLLAAILLFAPFLFYTLLVEVETLLVDAQMNNQISLANSVAILFNNQKSLFDDLPTEIDESKDLIAQPLVGSVLLDGKALDWKVTEEVVSRKFGSEDCSFTLRLGESINQLHGFLEVEDADFVPRDPTIISLESSDHLRVNYINRDGDQEEIAFTFSRPGVASADTYLANKQGEDLELYAEVGAFLAETLNGVNIEFTIPMEIFGSLDIFAVTYVDVDVNPIGSSQRTTTQPAADQEYFELVVYRSAPIIERIESLGFENTQVMIFDTMSRKRGESILGAAQEDLFGGENQSRNFFQRIGGFFRRFYPGQAFRDLSLEDAEQRTVEVINSALNNEPTKDKILSLSGAPAIIAAYPIRAPGEVIGVAVVQQNVEDILKLLAGTLRTIVVVSLVIFAILTVALLGYSIRLAYRIQKLRSTTARAIDEYGRIKVSSLNVERNTGDEIGELARSIDSMLGRLTQHQTFLQRMPRTLRHEINNPLNTLSTSLENLRSTNDPEEQQRYLQSAQRGVVRIGRIVQNLSDAASLEDSLQNEELERVDMLRLLKSYVSNLENTHKDVEFILVCDEQSAIANVSDFHIEQMLDKIIDNAIDFHRHDSPISVLLQVGTTSLRITVANRGPTLIGDTAAVFDSLVSMRGTQSTMHFGLGLYVVRVIVEYHGGTVQAVNLEDGSGVAITVDLPLAAVAPEQSSVASESNTVEPEGH